MKAKYLEAHIGARYWEDTIVNGLEDVDGVYMPCRDGGIWKPLINLENGLIENWVKGNIADVHYKSADCNSFYLLDENKKVIGKKENGYVIDTMCPKEQGHGDYVIMDIDKEGFIKDFQDLTSDENWN